MAADYVEHPLLAEGAIEDRAYQADLAGAARESHTLVCLPTGLGKTAVSALVTADRLEADAGGRALLLAPTKPLVEQHAADYRRWFTLEEEAVAVFTGEVRPEDRADRWEEAQVVVATPQVVENDVVGGRISLQDVVHCTFDECHRATGDYAYTYIAERYHADAADPLVTGLSASPGGDEEAVLEVCENLGVQEVAVRTEEDPAVAEYTHDTDLTWERVELPEEILELRDALNDVIADRLERLKELGVASSTDPSMSESQLQTIRGRLQELVDADDGDGYEGMSLHAEVRKLRTAVTYAETQSVESLRRYFERQRNAARSSGASKASQRLVSEPKVKAAMRRAREFDDLHPKFRRARLLLAETLGIEGGNRAIVFTESRDTAEALTEFLGEHFATRRFVGQSDTEGSDGMTQNEQRETLEAFRAGAFEVLVSTSVAEEGLDVPEVDLVLFFEPVPTAIRSVQRKGRTGRQSEGRVVVLLAEDTRDEAYYWISKRREEEMAEELRALEGIEGELEAELGQEQITAYGGNGAAADGGGTDEKREGVASPTPDGQAGLGEFEAGDDSGGEEGVVASAGGEQTVEVVVDQREMDASIGRELSARGDIEVTLETLAVGDYVLSDRVVVERKTVADFLDTLTGGERSLFEQVGDAARHYARPVVVLEGGDLYGRRNVHPNAIRGALASLAVDFGASVLQTGNEGETADLLATVATREQDSEDRAVSVHGEKAAKTLAEQQEYVVASIADVGPVTARALLGQFGSVEAALTASEEELLSVEGVGEVTAERVREVVGSAYEPD